jgi:hydroxyacylglutathione hydrolase
VCPHGRATYVVLASVAFVMMTNTTSASFIASFPAGPWQTNCYVVAAMPGSECVIIDPGMDAVAGVTELIMEHRLKPVAMMLTHGHLDHMCSVTPLCRSYDSICWVHPDDRVLLTDPLRAMGLETRLLLERLTGSTAAFSEPDDVRELNDGAEVAVAGLRFQAIHTPGHTPGSTMFQTELRASGIARRRTEPRSPRSASLRERSERLTGGEPFFPLRATTAAADSKRDARAALKGAYQASGDIDSVVFSGDVLFAGSIGRTDLPGGSLPDMLKSLRAKVLPLPDTVAVLPGHGPQTTMARERIGNPYLQNLAELSKE